MENSLLGREAVVNALVTPTKALLDTSQIADVIEKGVDSFMKIVPPLTKVLDEVAKIHPFMSGEPTHSTGGSKYGGGTHTGVVLPVFKAVYALEMTRREDAKRILARVRCSTAIED